MKTLLQRTVWSILIVISASWILPACTAVLINFSVSAVEVTANQIGQTLVITIPVTATSYNGSNGNGPITLQVTSTGPIDVTGATANVTYGVAGSAGTVTLNATVKSSPLTSGTFTFTNYCGTFISNFPSTLPYTVKGLGGGTTVPPPWGHNVFTGGGIEPVSMATGELFGEWTTDFNLGGPARLAFQRYYSSYLKANNFTSSLGNNWQHNFDTRLSISGTNATVLLFGGQAVKFTKPSALWQLAGPERRPYQLSAAGSGFQFSDPIAQKIYTFDGSGLLTSIADRNGNTLTISQGANGIGPTQVSDGLGRTLTFTYTGNALSKVSDQSGRSVSFENTNGNLSTWTDANGKKTAFAYATAGNLTGLLSAATLALGNKPYAQTYDSQGRVTSQTDATGNAMSLVYAPTGTTLTEPLGVTLTYTHDPTNNLTALGDPSGRATRYTYDSSGRPLTSTNRAGAQSILTWDATSGLPSQFSDGAGGRTSFRYASSTTTGFTFFDLTGVTLADGTTGTIARDASGNATAITDSQGQIWQAMRNSRGQIATLKDPNGSTTTLNYNSDGTIGSITFPNGLSIPLLYDGAKRISGLTWPGGTTLTGSYDARDNLIRLTNEANASVAQSMNDNNRPRTVTDALGSVTTLTYDGNDRLTAITDPLGRTRRFTYDAAGRVSTQTDGSGVTLTYTYNAANQLTGITDTSSKGTTFTLDGEGRPLGWTDALGRASAYTRDARGLVTGYTSPNNEKSAFAYDSRKRLTQITDAVNRATAFVYNSAGSLTRASLPGGISASYSTTSNTDPNGSIWRRSFDAATNQQNFIDPLGQTISYSYDSRRRITGVKFPDGDLKRIFDAAGNVTSLTYSDGLTISSNYDANQRIKTTSGLSLGYDASGLINNSNGLTITRDGAGRIASITYAAGKTVRYTYDNRGLLTQVADWVGGSTSFTYDAAKQITAVLYANGVRTDFTYDVNGRLSSAKAARQGTPIASITLQRDALGRITSADRSASTIPDVPGGVLPLAYDAAHQSVNATYDPRGQITGDGTRTYSWDGAGRLKAYTGVDGSASFAYDGFALRTARTSGGATQTYLWNYATRIPTIATVQSAGADLRYYVWLPNGSLLNSIEASGNARRFYHFDESASTIALTDETGSVTDTYATTPFGETITRTGRTENPFTYQGAFGVMQEGNTGLYYVRARYYDSATARFLSRDPRPSAAPDSINPYQFVSGNPLERVDQTGLQVESVRVLDAFPIGFFYIPGTDNVLYLSTASFGGEPDFSPNSYVDPFHLTEGATLAGGYSSGLGISYQREAKAGFSDIGESLSPLTDNPLFKLDEYSGRSCGIYPGNGLRHSPWGPNIQSSGSSLDTPSFLGAGTHAVSGLDLIQIAGAGDARNLKLPWGTGLLAPQAGGCAFNMIYGCGAGAGLNPAPVPSFLAPPPAISILDGGPTAPVL